MVDEQTETPETPVQDIHAPVDPMDIRLNFNCMLYLFTELLSLYNELLVVLKERGDLTDEEINRIYATTSKEGHLQKVYGPVFRRFAEYYTNLKMDVTGEAPEVVRVENASDTPAENSANPVGSTAVTASTTVVQEETENN